MLDMTSAVEFEANRGIFDANTEFLCILLLLLLFDPSFYLPLLDLDLSNFYSNYNQGDYGFCMNYWTWLLRRSGMEAYDINF